MFDLPYIKIDNEKKIQRINTIKYKKIHNPKISKLIYEGIRIINSPPLPLDTSISETWQSN